MRGGTQKVPPRIHNTTTGMKIQLLNNISLHYITTIFSFLLTPLILTSQSWEELLTGGWVSDLYYPTTKVLDAQRGWLLIPDGNTTRIDRLYRTIDGGDNWTLVLESTPADYEFNCIAALDTNRVWIGGSESRVIRTTDGGQSWQNVDPPQVAGGLENGSISQIQFDDPDRGWVLARDFVPVRNERILYTANGGQSWEVLLDLNAFEVAMGWPTHPYILTQMLVNDQVILAFLLRDGSSGLAPNALLRSTDGGQTWAYHGEGIPRTSSQSFAQQVHDSLIMLPGRNNARLHRSTDQGLTWQTVPLQESDINSSMFYNSCGFINDTVGWVSRFIEAGGVAYISFTNDGGYTFFDQRQDNLSMQTFQIVNDSLVFVGGPFRILRYRGGQAECASVLLYPSPEEPSPLSPLLRWSRSPGCVDGYRLRLSLSADFSAPFVDVRLGTDTTYQLTSPLPEGVQVYVDILPFNYQFGDAPACNLRYTFSTVNCPEPVLVEATLCAGDSLTLAEDLTVTEGGVYERFYTTSYGCDSLVVWSVTEAPRPITGILAPLCSGDTLRWQDTLITAGGLYEFSYLSAAGCDSLVRLNVSERSPAYTSIDTAIIAGQPWGGVVYAADTSLVYVLTGVNGCDSIVTVNLMLITATGQPLLTPGALNCALFPNPGSAQEAVLRVWSPEGCRIDAALHDALGQSLMRWAITAPQGVSVWPLPAGAAELPPGIYLISLGAPEGNATAKWVKM